MSAGRLRAVMHPSRAGQGARGAAKRLRAGAAALVTRTVRVAPDALVPVDARLKEAFDTTTYWVDPSQIQAVILNERRMIDAATADRFEPWPRLRDYHGLWKSIHDHPSRLFTGRFVLGGRWDAAAEPFERHHSYEAVRSVVEGSDWEETREYRSMIEDIGRQDFRYTKGCQSRRDVDDYFRGLAQLVESIATHGYRSQPDLGGRAGDEIRVLIGAQGDLIAFGGGTHRLAAGQLVGAPCVAVIVKGVHARWARCQLRGHSPPLAAAISEALRGRFEADAPT